MEPSFLFTTQYASALTSGPSCCANTDTTDSMQKHTATSTAAIFFIDFSIIRNLLTPSIFFRFCWSLYMICSYYASTIPVNGGYRVVPSPDDYAKVLGFLHFGKALALHFCWLFSDNALVKEQSRPIPSVWTYWFRS